MQIRNYPPTDNRICTGIFCQGGHELPEINRNQLRHIIHTSWPSRPLSTCCSFSLSPGGSVTNSLWTLACVVIGPLTSYGQEQRYMIHRAELNPNVKNNEKCPLQPLARLLCCISRASPICGNGRCCSLPCSDPLFQSVSIVFLEDWTQVCFLRLKKPSLEGTNITKIPQNKKKTVKKVAGGGGGLQSGLEMQDLRQAKATL